jgi:hypothetical protein
LIAETPAIPGVTAVACVAAITNASAISEITAVACVAAITNTSAIPEVTAVSHSSTIADTARSRRTSEIAALPADISLRRALTVA